MRRSRWFYIVSHDKSIIRWEEIDGFTSSAMSSMKAALPAPSPSSESPGFTWTIFLFRMFFWKGNNFDYVSKSAIYDIAIDISITFAIGKNHQQKTSIILSINDQTQKIEKSSKDSPPPKKVAPARAQSLREWNQP